MTAGTPELYTEDEVFEKTGSGETEHYILWVEGLTETLNKVDCTEKDRRAIGNQCPVHLMGKLISKRLTMKISGLFISFHCPCLSRPNQAVYEENDEVGWIGHSTKVYHWLCT